MCAPDPNAAARFQAEQLQQEKIAKHGSESIKYWNRETDYKRGREASALGFSRAQSDAYTKALNIVGQGRAGKAALTQEYAVKQYVDEGGRSRRAGRSALVALLAKTSALDSAADNAFGAKMDAAHQGLLRRYNSFQIKNRERLGVKPEWGAPVLMPPRDKTGQFLASLSQGLSIATSIVGLAGPVSGMFKGLGVLGGASKAVSGAGAMSGAGAFASGLPSIGSIDLSKYSKIGQGLNIPFN